LPDRLTTIKFDYAILPTRKPPLDRHATAEGLRTPPRAPSASKPGILAPTLPAHHRLCPLFGTTPTQISPTTPSISVRTSDWYSFHVSSTCPGLDAYTSQAWVTSRLPHLRNNRTIRRGFKPGLACNRSNGQGGHTRGLKSTLACGAQPSGAFSTVYPRFVCHMRKNC
jgi:hypothetical protein